MFQLQKDENEISSNSHIVECSQGCTPMRHAQPRPSMTYMKLILVDATFGLGVKTSRTLGVRMKLHGLLVSDLKFMHSWSRSETPGNLGLRGELHKTLVSV